MPAAVSPPVIAVAEHDAAVRAGLGKLLAALGVHARLFETARALLDGLGAGNSPTSASVVIADAELPDMDGLELLDELRRRGDATPVILLSSHADVASAVAAMRAGALDFIEKPYIDRAILDHVQRLTRDRTLPH